MSTRGRAGDGTHWLIAAGGAALVFLAFAALFRDPRVMVPALTVHPPKPAILLGAGRSEELAMRDLTPLFLPTKLNAAPKGAKPAEPGRAFFEHDPGEHTVFDPDNPALTMPPRVRPPDSVAAAVGFPPPPVSAGIGRTDLKTPARPPTGGRVDVYGATGAESLLGVTLPADAAPPVGREGVRWQPLEFAVAIDAAGLVDSLILTRGSGSEEVDGYFRKYLASRFRLGDRLPPGFYRVVVAP